MISPASATFYTAVAENSTTPKSRNNLKAVLVGVTFVLLSIASLLFGFLVVYFGLHVLSQHQDAVTPSYCFGKSFMDVTVCGGRGYCRSTNKCVCAPGFKGIECQETDTQVAEGGANAPEQGSNPGLVVLTVIITCFLFFAFGAVVTYLVVTILIGKINERRARRAHQLRNAEVFSS